MSDDREPWERVMKVRTPDSDIELSGERFLAGKKEGGKRWRRGRNYKSRVVVSEPLMGLLDEVMAKEGVSDKRMERALGLYDKKINAMRKEEGLWKTLRLVRAMFGAMGYDVEITVKRRRTPDKTLVMTRSEVALREVFGKLDAKKVAEGKRYKSDLEKWDKLKMWKWLGMEKLEEGD